MVPSTVEPLLGVTKDEKKKPAIMKFYDFTKGGTDIIDKKNGHIYHKDKIKSMDAHCILLFIRYN